MRQVFLFALIIYSNVYVFAQCQSPISATRFKSIISTLDDANTDEERITTAKSILKSDCFSSDQIAQICDLFDWDNYRLEFASSAYAKCYDPTNYYQINKTFDFDDNRVRLNNHVIANLRQDLQQPTRVGKQEGNTKQGMLVRAEQSVSSVQFCIDPPQNSSVFRDIGSSGVYNSYEKWNTGQKINVCFKGSHSAYIAEKIKRYSQEWEKYANIDFAFYDNEIASPDILIEIVRDGMSWSMIGKGSRQRSLTNNASMHFGWFDDNTTEEEFRRVTLHEFGHALGLCHEHQNPTGNIQWNKPVVYGYFCEKCQPPWSREKVERNIFDKLSGNISNRTYDTLSIMHYSVPKEFTLNGISVPHNTILSKGDKEIIAEMYPANTPYDKMKILVTIDSVKIEHNIYQHGQKGMIIKPFFHISNAKGIRCRLVAHFYNATNGNPLKTRVGNTIYTTTDSCVSSGGNFCPCCDDTRMYGTDLYIPYDEFNLKDGLYKIKFPLVIYDRDHDYARINTNSGYFYFTYRTGQYTE